MNLAVLLYKFVLDAPAGIPGEWPAEVRELNSDLILPGENWVHMTSASLASLTASLQGEYDAWEDSLIPAFDPVAYVATKISAARIFGIEIVTYYGASNVLKGLSVEQVQEVMATTSKIVAALNTGSLYVAIAEINAVVPDGVIIKESELTKVRNQIEDYLQIPRT